MERTLEQALASAERWKEIRTAIPNFDTDRSEVQDCAVDVIVLADEVLRLQKEVHDLNEQLFDRTG